MSPLAGEDVRHPPARRARLRERLCAGDAAQEGRRARHPFDRRSRRARRNLTIAGDYEFFDRPEWKAIARRLWPASSASSARCSRISCTSAARAATSTSSSAYTSDGQIAQYDLNVLDRSETRASRPMTRSCCWRRNARTTTKLIAALKPLIGAIPVETDARGQPARRGGGASPPDAGGAMAMGQTAVRANIARLVRNRRCRSAASLARFSVMPRMQSPASNTGDAALAEAVIEAIGVAILDPQPLRLAQLLALCRLASFERLLIGDVQRLSHCAVFALRQSTISGC